MSPRRQGPDTKAAQNEILQLLLGSMRRVLRKNMHVLAANHATARFASIKYHRQILEAVRAHDAESARSAMRRHLEQATFDLRELASQGLDFSED